MSSVQPEVEPRTLRAATEHMTVIEKARSLFSVTTESGSEYMVDLRELACMCPDFQHRESVKECKHIRRVRIEVGQVDIDTLEAQLAETATDLEASADELESKAPGPHRDGNRTSGCDRRPGGRRMSRPDPAAALNGVGTGQICDSCNRRIQHGDKVGMYVTYTRLVVGLPDGRGVWTAIPKRLTPVLTGPTKQSCSGFSSHTSSSE